MKRYVFILILIMIVFLSGCSVSSSEPGVNSAEASVVEEFRGMQQLGQQAESLSATTPTFYEYRDSVTGVHYLVFYESSWTGQGTGVGIAMCPRYNADGTLYVD